MISQLVGEVEGIGGFKILSMLIFFSVFVAALYRAWRMDDALSERMSRLPLDETGSEILEQE